MLAPPARLPMIVRDVARASGSGCSGPAGASSGMPGVPSSPCRKLGGSHLTQRLFRQILGRIERLAREEADMGPCRNSGSEAQAPTASGLAGRCLMRRSTVVARWPRSVVAVAPLVALLLLAGTTPPAGAGGTLRIAMTAADVPTTTGMPNNGYEGMRFLGFPVFEGLILFDLTRSDVLAPLRPGLAERWEQDKADPTRWTFNLRRGVKFPDGSDFNADAVIWNLERYYNTQSKQFETQGSDISRGRYPLLNSFRKVDASPVEIQTPRPVSY